MIGIHVTFTLFSYLICMKEEGPTGRQFLYIDAIWEEILILHKPAASVQPTFHY